MSVDAAQKMEPSSLKILRLPQVCEVKGLCRSMIYQMEAERRFPKRVRSASARSAGSKARYTPGRGNELRRLARRCGAPSQSRRSTAPQRAAALSGLRDRGSGGRA
jgi:predicted DNA-binding transcriptional regulator AlpA